MSTYRTILLDVPPEPSSTGTLLYQPPSSYSGLIQALRVVANVSETGRIDNPLQLVISIRSPGVDKFPIAWMPLPATGRNEIYDVMGYLSNLASFGLAGGASLSVNPSETLQGQDSIKFWGFSIEGLAE